jgi:hypothetical protein
MQFDIKWHDIKEEMPGTNYDISNCVMSEFLLRYTFEDEDIECLYDIGHLSKNKFILNFDGWSEEERDDRRDEARILHWAYLDHPSDYD